MLKVGIPHFLNTLPFLFTNIYEKKISSIFLEKEVPSALNKKLLSQNLDLALISASEYLRNKNKLVHISNLCIAAEKHVRSVSLYTQKPLNQLNKVALTYASDCSKTLIQILCKHFWQVSPIFFSFNNNTLPPQSDAFLLIGDLCLKHPSFPGFKTFDLANLWYQFTNLPFTFAVFAATKSAYKTKQKEIDIAIELFSQSKKEAFNNKDNLLSIAQKYWDFSKDTIDKYLSNIHYDMDERHIKSLQLFETYIKK